MRVKLSKYGWPETVILPLAISGAMILCLLAGKFGLPPWIVTSIEVILAVLLFCALAFFRDPKRLIPPDKNILLAPADGRITDIQTTEENDFIGGPTLRIGIFLSVFNVHINRAPCNARVETITYKKGQYKDARDPRATLVNESNAVALVRIDSPHDRLIVRQISGAIARRIVCRLNRGQKLASGEKFGMIKFGSRTELYLPANGNAECLVRPGDKVKAGLTALVRYRK